MFWSFEKKELGRFLLEKKKKGGGEKDLIGNRNFTSYKTNRQQPLAVQ